MTSLAEHMDASVQRQEPFEIDGLKTADWAIRKLRDAVTQRDSNVRVAEKWIAEVNEWLASVNAEHQGTIDFFTAHLELYALKERAAGRKSVKLPHGVVKTTEVPEGIEVVDEAAAIEWAEVSAPGLVQSKKSIDKKALAIGEGGVFYTLTGDLVPGLNVRQSRVSVSVQVKP